MTQARVLDKAIIDTRPLHGGDLSEVALATLADGRRVVIKRGPLVDVEGRMLTALAEAGAPVPQVLEVAKVQLCLSYLEESTPTPTLWRQMGRALADLHRARGESYGWDEDYAFGAVRIDNARSDDWPAFWAERRLLSGVESLPGDVAQRIEALARRLPDLLPKRPDPALLHGDLWSGNLLFTADAAFLIDPACYVGDAEVDLAMLSLFGAPPAAFHDGYGPVPPGAEARRPIYQLWPALVHLRLFGAGYRGMVSRLLDAAGA
ncbi:fructosamine kinase family protein [Thalassococcus sp. BH17M4-6]|uniref:fructosamine kinase family protein n=1 Tax=Thalassococcus sp. BH17M4-6 TaxID=3413148 RepID=UPI003BCAD463